MSEPYRLLDLFSGIGGFSLGFERSGAFKTVAFCEIEPFCRKVLAKHWPDVPCYDDIRTLTAERLAADGISVDAICGGFPCQDISVAGKGAGIEGERSGLWSEYARLIGELRPHYVIVENVGALLHRGMDAVLGTLADLGYDAEWRSIRASELGAPHHRERIWIVAYPCQVGRDRGGRCFVAQDEIHYGQEWASAPFSQWGDVVDWLNSIGQTHIWEITDRETGGMDDGVSPRLDRPDIGALGNAVVPQIPELIGRAIAQAERAA